MASHVPVIQLKGISKAFGPVRANADIDLEIHRGKIKALLGENGAGKSTLMSILAGRLAPDSGAIRLDGRDVVFGSTREAIAAGIGMVYQHFALVETMTVAENVFLGQEGRFWLHPRQMGERVAELARRYGLEIDPNATIRELSMGERQRVEILKLLLRDSQVLILDEPTAVLTPHEIDQLFTAMTRMAEQGRAIVFISHKLKEVMRIADDIAILRKGRIVDTLPAEQVTSQSELARRMVGRDVLLSIERKPLPRGRRVLHVRRLQGLGLEGIDLDVHQGEIVGVVGVAGNGQKPLIETVCGLKIPGGGTVSILDKNWHEFYSRRPVDRTLCYIPEDRLGLATCPGLNLKDNFLLTTRQRFTRGIWLQKRRAEQSARDLIREFHVDPPNPAILARQLSGGNLQKMVIGREFFRTPRLIVAEQPTQGLDVAATEEVWSYLLRARSDAGILLVTGDLNEALTLSDRIVVLFRGQVAGVFDAADERQIDRIGMMMAGMAA